MVRLTRPRLPRLPKLPRVASPFDGDDLKLMAQGVVLAVVIAAGVLFGAAVIGLAVRVFVMMSGVR